MNENRKLVLITGATAGIGLATAKIFASRGHELLLLARRSERLGKIKGMLEVEFKAKVHCFGCDVSNLGSIRKLISENSELFGRVDVLVNNAGLGRGWAPFYKASEDDWNRVIDTNHKGFLYMIREIAPFMRKRNSGHVVNLGSVAGRWVNPNDIIYCATKFAVRSISESLRIDLFGTDVRVTNIEPGPVKTEIAHTRYNSPEVAEKVWLGYEPLRPEDVADAIFWATEQPPHVNIQELVLFPTCMGSVFQLDKR